MSEGRWSRIRAELKHAFAVSSEDREFTEEEQKLLDKIAKAVVSRGMAVPAMMFLETVKPLNMVGSQLMAFVQPYVDTIIHTKDYDVLRTMMEDRRTVYELINRIERFEQERIAAKRSPKDVESEGEKV